MLLEGKSALITGAGRGIGRAIAIAFAKQGCRIAALARSSGELEETAGLVRGEGQEALVLKTDVTDAAAVAEVVAQAQESLGGIDLLVNNAGYANFKPFLEYTIEEVRRTIDVNVVAPFLFMQAAAPGMIARKSGRIINISSVAGLKPIMNQSLYCASKHGLNGLSKVIAMELREHGIAVHWVCPGGVDTKLSREAMPERDKTNWMTPEDIAQACLYLASLSPRCTVDELMIRRFGSVPLGG
jgi:3-oxoacyl-[acyl-carrier protein] reductase